jgi:hypothetical protein
MIKLQPGKRNELNMISNPEVQTGFQLYTIYIQNQLKTEPYNEVQTVRLLMLFIFLFLSSGNIFVLIL